MSNESDEPTQQNNFLRQWIHWIMGGLLAWGFLLGLGAYLYGGEHALLRGLIVAMCATAFVTFWWAALLIRGDGPRKRANLKGPSGS